MKQIAEFLLAINAVKLSPEKPFTWTSGWKSPIYCDNRKTLSYPQVRTEIAVAFVETIREKYPEVEAIAGVATGAIAIAALVADCLELPMVYIRPSEKEHGLKNKIEGEIFPDQNKFVIIEDLISTGGSSLKAVQALKDANCEVLGMTAIFSYQLPKAQKAFTEAGCDLTTLTDYSELLEVAIEQNYIREEDQILLAKWRLNPDTWGQPKQ